jgi:hypothetical protein
VERAQLTQLVRLVDHLLVGALICEALGREGLVEFVVEALILLSVNEHHFLAGDTNRESSEIAHVILLI